LNIKLLNFKDICLNGYHIDTKNEKDMKYLYISTIELKKKCITEIINILLCFVLHIY